ncbi:MAG TPA: hypothetical protein VD866_24000 [Urbifossiella sp.]|nr:hypothetical protein [Urbifossiella sp.]
MARWWSVVLFVGLTTSLAAGFPPGPPASPEIQAKPRPRVAVNQGQRGRVIAFDKESLTINPAVQMLTQLDRKAPPRRFVFSATLKAGGYEPQILNQFRYAMADLKVGDIIQVEYDRLGDVETCTMFSILSRPGGRVPPARDPNPLHSSQHHERANAEQDLVERGIPLPERLQEKLPTVPSPSIPPAAP